MPCHCELGDVACAQDLVTCAFLSVVVAAALVVRALQPPPPLTDNAALVGVPCAALGRLQIFSHRGLSGEGNALPESAIATESSFLALHRRAQTRLSRPRAHGALRIRLGMPSAPPSPRSTAARLAALV